jgi:Trk K+ transport system NAD-binding subunit
MNILVVGCSPIGALLSCELSEEHNVTLIDNEDTGFKDLSEKFNGKTVSGDILNPEFLRSLESDKLDLAVVATMHEQTDIMCGQILAKIVNVSKVTICVMDWQKIDLYKNFNLEILSLSQMAVNKIKLDIGS